MKNLVRIAAVAAVAAAFAPAAQARPVLPYSCTVHWVTISPTTVQVPQVVCYG